MFARLARASGRSALLLSARDDLPEAPVAEDEHDRGEPDPEGERPDRDLLADRVGRHRGAVNGTAAETALTPSTSSTFFTEPPTLKASRSIQKAEKRKHQPPS